MKILKTISLASIILFVFIVSVFSSENTTFWQLKLTYDSEKLIVEEAGRIRPLKKKVRTPGLKGAPNQIPYLFEWMNSDGNVIYSTQAILPLGRRTVFSAILSERAPCGLDMPASGVIVIRLEGPGPGIEPNSIRLTRIQDDPREIIRLPSPRVFEKTLQEIPIKSIRGNFSLPEGPVGVSKIHDTGPDENRLVIVVMGDGYTAANLAAGDFTGDAANLVSAFQGRAPWDVLFSSTNVYRVDIESNEEGADNEIFGDSVDTYLNSSFWTAGIQRLLTIDGVGYSRAISAADNLVGVGVWDQIFVLVNSEIYGGAGGGISTSSVHPSSGEIILHEFGHTFGGLADEYSSSIPGAVLEDPEPNVDLDFAIENLKWARWVLPSTPLPTPNTVPYESTVGAFEGARYFQSGIYRPWADCLMRSLGSEFGVICQEEHILQFKALVSLVDSLVPNANTILVGPNGIDFTVAPLPWLGMKFEWDISGFAISCAEGSSINLTSSALPYPTSELNVRVSYPTNRVRKDTIFENFSWTIISDCNDNGIADSLDILFETSSDENSNNVPDECEAVTCCLIPGDADGDSQITIGDATFLIKYIFSGGAAPECEVEADANAGGDISVGDATFLVKYIFQGGPAPACAQTLEWNPLACEMPRTIWGISGSSDSLVFAVGDNGALYRFDGLGWSDQSFTSSQRLRDIWGQDNDFYAVGDGGEIHHFDGSNWNQMTSGTTDLLYGVWGSSPGDVYAVGGEPLSNKSTLLHYNGFVWSELSGGSYSVLFGIWGLASNDIFAVGRNGQIVHYNGSEWQTQNSGVSTSLEGIWGSSPNDVYAVGEGGVILHYNGANWSQQTIGTSNNLWDVWGFGPNNVYVIGNLGLILHYDGASWAQQTSGTSRHLYAIWGATGTKIHSGGSSGALIRFGP